MSLSYPCHEGDCGACRSEVCTCSCHGPWVPRARPRARNTDPVTSHQAAESVTSLRSSQRAVLKLFNDMPAGYGFTDEDIAKHYPTKGLVQQSPSGLRTRRKELVDAGYLEDSGERRRMTTGRNAIVWRLATDSGTTKLGTDQHAGQPPSAAGYEAADVPEIHPDQTTVFDYLEPDDAEGDGSG